MIHLFFRTLAGLFSVTVWGFTMRACTWDRLLNLVLHRFGLMGRSERILFERIVKPGMIVVDVGANQGLYSLLLARLTGPTGKVFSFEPSAMLFQALTRNVQQNGARNIDLFPYALGKESSEMVLHSSLINSGDNRLGSRPTFCETTTVAVRKFDELLVDLRADFLKIDVQGWEMHVFQGMDLLFANSPQLQVLFEYWPRGLELAGANPLSVLHFFEKAGFRLHTVTEEGSLSESHAEEIHRTTRPDAYINILATR